MEDKNQKKDNNGSEEKYEFVTETIKKRPVNKKKIIGKIVFTIIMALVFGVIASFTFVFLYPAIYERLYPEKMKEVTIPLAEEAAEEPVEEFVPSEDEDDVLEENGDETDGNGNDDDAAEAAGDEKETDKNESQNAEEDGKEVVVNQVVETIEKELELDDYRSLYRKISSVGNSVLKSMVKVSQVNDATDWFSNTYEDNDTASGVIIADNGKEILIASLTDILADDDQVDVTFCDGNTYKSTEKRYDSTTGITIIGISLEDIDDSTMEKIEIASFGGISSMLLGTPVLAVGSPQGLNDSMIMGQITSSTSVDITDGSVKVLSTDMYGSTSASGVVANLNGRILGFICHEDLGQDMPNIIRAYSIIDLKDKIEKISNGQDLAVLGIIGTDVTETAYNELGVPFGTYVKKVDIDSPAMNAGIRSGDVIVKFDDTEINSFTDYKDAMINANPGDTIEITLMRPGRDDYTEITYEVTLE